MLLGDSKPGFLLKFDSVREVLEPVMTKIKLKFINIKEPVVDQENSTIKIFSNGFNSLNNLDNGKNWIGWT